MPPDTPFVDASLQPWPCLTQCRAQPAGLRVPLWVEGVVAGSVAQAHLPALQAWPQWLLLGPEGVRLGMPAEQRSAALAEINQGLRAQGLIRAWRDEPYALLDAQDRLCATIERASARFWGSRTFGAHCNGFVADATGRPTHLWIARRAWDKPTDPGLLDNLIGGGVPLGQSPRQALLREAWEEAGLQPAQLTGLQRGRTAALDCDVAEGRQCEWLYVYDLPLPAGLLPQNQDGEVAEFRLMPVAQALAAAAAGEMTVDAALSTLDFALRQALLPPAAAQRLAAAAAGLWVAPALAARFDPPD